MYVLKSDRPRKTELLLFFASTGEATRQGPCPMSLGNLRRGRGSERNRYLEYCLSLLRSMEFPGLVRAVEDEEQWLPLYAG